MLLSSLFLKTIPRSASTADSAVLTSKVILKIMIALKMKCWILFDPLPQISRKGREEEVVHYCCSTTLNSWLFKKWCGRCKHCIKNSLSAVKLLQIRRMCAYQGIMHQIISKEELNEVGKIRCSRRY